jgi:thiamine pyrophosphate-dependent acetolactate synthase large subunit-like protein
MCDISGIDWVALAAGFGVGAVAVQTTEDLMAALDSAIASGGPFLIEAWI